MSAGLTTTTCLPWCVDHRDYGDLEHCQSEDRDVEGQTLFLVGPELLAESDGLHERPGFPAGIFFFVAREGMPGAPLTLEQARTELEERVAEIRSLISIADALSQAIDDLAGSA